MNIDYTKIMALSSEGVEDYICRNNFTDKQKLEYTDSTIETEKIKQQQV